MALSYKDDEKQDERLNPASDGARDLYHQEQDAYDREFNDIADNYGKTADGKKEDQNADKTKNIDKAKEQERDGGGWKNNFDGNNSKKQKFDGKAFLKKKGPLGLIIGLLLGGGGGLTLLFSPGALIVDLKEKMVNKFDDQLATMDVRSTAMLKKKFSGSTKGLCTSVVSIRCKFNTMSDRQLKKLEDAGIKVNKTGDTTLIRGRSKIASFEFEGKTIKASDFTSELRTNTAFRGAMMRGYNPKLAGFADSTFMKLAGKLGINKQKNITGNSEEERQKSVVDSANGNKVAEGDAKVISSEEDCNSGADCKNGKRTVYKDATTGDTIDKAEYDKRISESSALKGEFDARKALGNTGETAAKGTLKGALTVTALGMGAVDSACTGYTLIRTVGFAAKYLGALQLLRYAQVFMNTADSIKAGDATPEQVEYAGRTLTTTNVLGQGATDSYGYKYAAYGDVQKMPRSDDITPQSVGANGNNVQLSDQQKQQVLVNDETTKYINGQLVSDNLLSKIIGFVGKAGPTAQIDDFCGFVKSGWGQTIVIGGAVVGAVVAFFSGGLSLGWGTVAQVAVSAAISIALAMLTPKLIDMAAATLITGHENGNQAGNAITSGMGAYNDQTSSARGIPALKKEDGVAYQQLTDQTWAQYAAVDRLNYSPLDPTNPNTFMGSLVSKIIPYTSKVSSLSGGMSTLAQFTTSTFASILPSASAADPSAQYNVCEDRDYKELDVAVDPFCNIRHGLSTSTLGIDSDTVLDYMINNNYIDETTGDPKASDNEYAKYLENCTDRSVSIGGYVSADNTDKGEECIQGHASGSEEYKYNMFRLYYIDFGINDGMENGYVAKTAASVQTSAATPEMCKTLPANDLGQIACKAYQFDDYGYLWGGGHSGTAQGFMSNFAAGKYKAGKDRILDCSGLVRMSIFAATGVDVGGLGSGAFAGNSKFKEIAKADAKAGDLMTQPGHIEIIVSNDPSTQTYKTFGAHTDSAPFDKMIGPSGYSYSSVSKVLRFVN